MTDIQILYDGPIVKRADAKKMGLQRYFTGRPCKHGHVDDRRVSSGACVKCGGSLSKKWNEDNYVKNKARYQKWRINNPDKVREFSRVWARNNRASVYANNLNYRARKNSAAGSHSYNDVKKILRLQGNKCAEPTCGVDLSGGYHVDHIMPLSKGGSNWPSNLQCLCPTCNIVKGAKLPHEWARENGRLL